MDLEKFNRAKEISGLIENLKSRINKAERLLTSQNVSCKISGNLIEHYINIEEFIHTALRSDIEIMKKKLADLETQFKEI
jgi:hypothetical protein